jgi:hypothetical protein
MSFTMISLGVSPLLLACLGILSVWRLSLPLLGIYPLAIGEGFPLGMTSADAESQSLVNRMSRLRGLPSAPPHLLSLTFSSACSPFLTD